jgi:hypothetical protein
LGWRGAPTGCRENLSQFGEAATCLAVDGSCVLIMIPAKPAIADGGEVVISVPHIEKVSYLGSLDPAAVNLADREERTGVGILVGQRAGEMVYRIRRML